MAHARFIAAILRSSISGAAVLAAVTLTCSDAFAAARPDAKAVAPRTARARRSSEPPSAVRRNGDAPKDSSAAASPPGSKDTPSRDRSGTSEKSSQRGGERGAKSASDVSSNTKIAPTDTRAGSPSDVGKDGKPSSETNSSPRSGDGTSGRSTDTAAHRSTDATTGRSSDARAGAAKAPNENASNASPRGAQPERSGADAAAADTSEPTRAVLDSATSARRELAPSSGGGGGNVSAAGRPVVVTLEGPIFDGGDVPRAATALERMKGAFGRCASVENAFAKNEASIDLRFLVRAPGRAEGVDAGAAKGVSSDVVRCMTSVLARSYIGAPSDDPVGVAVTVRMRREAGNN